jgi:predicted branched-subunit amino acid permease
MSLEGPPPAATPWPEPRPPLWRQAAFWLGVREMAPTAVGIGAWGLITGVAMGNSGMAAWVMVCMSLIVYAGSAQLAVLPLMSNGAPLWVIWATALCVNLRFAVFSLHWRPYFKPYPLRHKLLLAHVTADLNYVFFMRRFPQPQPHADQWPYLWGTSAIGWISWQVCSMLGLFLADAVPVHWGLGFAGILALLGIVCSMVSDRLTALSATVAGTAAIAAYALPLKLNILVAIACAVAVGALAQAGSATKGPANPTAPPGR